MKKMTYLIMSFLFLLSSCTKLTRYYSEYKKYLGLDVNENFLLEKNDQQIAFKNEDIKIEEQNFKDEIDSKKKLSKTTVATVEPKKDIEQVKEVKEQKQSPEFNKYLAMFNSDRNKLKGETDVERAPASITPHYENPYYKAQSLIKKGKFVEAEYNLKIYLKDNPKNAEHAYSCFFNLAELSLVKEDYISAIANYYEILNNKYENTNYELIYFKLYESYLNMGRKDLAEKYFFKIKELNPVSRYIKLVK